MKKRYRIKSKLRFTVFLSLLLASFILIAAQAGDCCRATGKAYKEVTVKSGDTLWQLSKTYGPKKQDIRRTVYTICRINNISPGNLYPGMSIEIPQ